MRPKFSSSDTDVRVKVVGGPEIPYTEWESLGILSVDVIDARFGAQVFITLDDGRRVVIERRLKL